VKKKTIFVRYKIQSEKLFNKTHTQSFKQFYAIKDYDEDIIVTTSSHTTVPLFFQLGKVMAI